MSPEASLQWVRRGLPRVAGGEPWPPAAQVEVQRLAVAEAPAPAPAAADAAAPAASAVPAAAAAPAGDGRPVLRTFRQGLPRVSGGEAWPPKPDPSEFVTTPAAPAAVAAPAEAPAAAAPAAAAAGVPAAAAGGRPVLRSFRQGLPRVAGGEPWPPEPDASAFVTETEAVPEATPAAAAVEAAAPAAQAAAPAAPASAPVAASVAAPATSAPAPSAAAAATATATAAPAAPAKPAERKPMSRTTQIILGAAALIVLAAIVVVIAKLLRDTGPVQDFLTRFPGASELPRFAPTGFPLWLRWQHYLNALFIVLIIRSGWLNRTQGRPPAFWTRNNTGRFKTKNPPKKISLTVWVHLFVDIFWVLNGVIFYILVFSTRQWTRIIPVHWDVFPNAISAALQYASLQWPTEDGWSNYNALQLITYFVTVFIAAPLAMATGFRMSPLWPSRAERLSKAYPLQLARAIHFPTMLYFVLFIIVHVVLVFSTGALRNLNHMFGGSDVVSWVGFTFFAVGIVFMVAAWVLSRPLFVTALASKSGSVTAR